MSKLPRAILFDLDGVLVDSYWVWLNLLNHVARVHDYPEITNDVYETGWGQSTTADRDAFFPNHTVSEVEAFYDEHYFEHLEHMRVAPEVPKVFSRLKELGIASAVCTNTQASLAKEIVQRTGATPEHIVGGNDVPKPKPAPDMLLRACELLEVKTDAAWMIGDSRYDRDAARVARIHFVGVRFDGDQRIEALGELVDRL